MADLPIQRIGPTGPAATGAQPRPAGGTPTPPAPLPLPQTGGAAPTQTVLSAITRAVADLPPDTALSVFLAAVKRVTAEVEARLADPAKPAGRSRPVDPGQMSPGIGPDLAEVSQRDLAAAAALIASRLTPDRNDPLSPVAADARDPRMMEPMMRDRLYLLPATFADPALPGRTFYCRDCVTVDGLLALFPEAARRLEVIRIDYPRPRRAVVDAIGVLNQNLPVLVLADDADPALADGEHRGTRFVGDLRRLLHALHVRHGFPEAHP